MRNLKRVLKVEVLEISLKLLLVGVIVLSASSLIIGILSGEVNTNLLN